MTQNPHSADTAVQRRPEEIHIIHKKKRNIPLFLLRAAAFLLLVVIAIAFLLPIVLTIANSFMTSSEISANYGQVFSGISGQRTFIAEKVNLKAAMSGENGAERVKNYTVPMGAGLDFNFGARPVDDNILAILAKFAEEQQMVEKLLKEI